MAPSNRTAVISAARHSCFFVMVCILLRHHQASEIVSPRNRSRTTTFNLIGLVGFEPRHLANLTVERALSSAVRSRHRQSHAKRRTHRSGITYSCYLPNRGRRVFSQVKVVLELQQFCANRSV